MGGCMGKGNINRQDLYVSETITKKCRVANCTDNHEAHYCKNCNINDVDHFSRQCQKVITTPNQTPLKCKVKGCRQNHKDHWCTMCKIKGVNHFARGCPEAKVLYHGTTQTIAQLIKGQGFKESASGCRGKGVYFTDQQNVAGKVANYRSVQRGNEGVGVILKCVAPNKFVEQVDRGEHGVWNGVTSAPFQEFVVRNPKQIRIIQIRNA